MDTSLHAALSSGVRTRLVGSCSSIAPAPHCPLRLATDGGSQREMLRSLTEAEALNLVHPLVRSAIAHARTWSGDGSIKLQLSPSSSPELAALAGKTGLLCDRARRLRGLRASPAACRRGGGRRHADRSIAGRQIMRLQATDSPAFKVPVEAQWLDDAVDEAVFVDQRQVEEGEQKHFEQAIGQLERFVEDKILVCRRERASIAEKLRAARARRDEIVGSSATRSGRSGDLHVWPQRKRVLSNASVHWNPGRTRFIENGATNITSFVTGHRR